ncbi:methyltransferase [Legionella sainthelensi]|uniref:class I SAM-dependent methyltransferase n=1 Tax=Legionella sainthelensi TaxID=28087 RepID=UPI000E20A1F0|nr:class I SAM-dependent methyltransferase [Legionella sainthelensi]VEB32664.1 methyltransferase [Legionella sainthelensi]
MHNKENNTPKAPAEFDLYSESYSEQINQSLAFSGLSHDFFTRIKADYLTHLFHHNSFLKNQSHINALDVGCGHGLIHPYLLANNNKLQLSGVDVASSVIDIALTTNPNVAYQTYDGSTLPYAENTFDVAYAICVMHHVPPMQWHNFLQEMKRVVKVNGLIVIFEHNPLNPFTLKVVKDCPLDKDAVLIRSKLMRKMMQQAGLTLLKNTYILFTPFDNPLFQKFDRMLGWLPLGAQYYTLSSKSL